MAFVFRALKIALLDSKISAVNVKKQSVKLFTLPTLEKTIIVHYFKQIQVAAIASIIAVDTKLDTHSKQLIIKTNTCFPKLSIFPHQYKTPHANIISTSNFILCCNAQKTLIRTNKIKNSQLRYYCDNRQRVGKQITMPRLMDFPQIAWPNIFKSLRNWILTRLIITPYFDREFDIQEFIDGSKQAVEYISERLASGEYDKLEDVVAPEALEEIKKRISNFSIQQRADLAVNRDDIYFSFPYEVGVMFDEAQSEKEQQKRFVEITVCYHVLKGIRHARNQPEPIALKTATSKDFQDKVFILNYRFIREFTKGINAEWIVNIVNHYRPSDYV